MRIYHVPEVDPGDRYHEVSRLAARVMVLLFVFFVFFVVLLQTRMKKPKR